MKHIGLISREVPNENGRCYPIEILYKIKHQINAKGSIYGQLSHPEQGGPIDLNKASHEIIDVSIEDNVLYVDVKILDTPEGNILFSVIDSVVFRPNGYGSLNEDGVHVNIDDYEIISFDAVLAREDSFEKLLKDATTTKNS